MSELLDHYPRHFAPAGESDDIFGYQFARFAAGRKPTWNLGQDHRANFFLSAAIHLRALNEVENGVPIEDRLRQEDDEFERLYGANPPPDIDEADREMYGTK